MPGKGVEKDGTEVPGKGVELGEEEHLVLSAMEKMAKTLEGADLLTLRDKFREKISDLYISGEYSDKDKKTLLFVGPSKCHGGGFSNIK